MTSNKNPKLERWIQDNPDLTNKELPTWETLSAAKNILKTIIKEYKSEAPNIDRLGRLTAASVILAEEVDSKYYATKLFASAIVRLEGLMESHPEVAHTALIAAEELATAAQMIIAGNAANRYNNNAAKIKPILKINEHAEIRRNKACELAKQIWDADADQELRLSEMAACVRDELQRDGHEDLPKIERIKEWIKSVAPPYARRPGRGKNPPKRNG